MADGLLKGDFLDFNKWQYVGKITQVDQVEDFCMARAQVVREEMDGQGV